ncbi:MAG TPA: peptidase E [Pseudonocardiaceae bacterium]
MEANAQIQDQDLDGQPSRIMRSQAPSAVLNTTSRASATKSSLAQEDHLRCCVRFCCLPRHAREAAMSAERPTILATSMGFNRARDPWRPSPIFRYAFNLAGSPTYPRLCFLTTGTGDRQTSIDRFYAAFADSGVKASHLALFEKPNIKNVSIYLHEQDVIWVDRGSLANLLTVWRAHDFDKIMRGCWQNGVVLGGESAGSLCWHAGGTTDSFGDVQPFTNGLGFLPYSNAVHYDERREYFQRCITSGVLPDGYATDAGAGLHYEDSDLVAAIADRKRAGAYRITRRSTEGGVREEPLEVRYLT